jgi:hypothetical protein
MASPTKITKAIRSRKIDKKNVKRARRVKKIVAQRIEILKVIENGLAK